MENEQKTTQGETEKGTDGDSNEGNQLEEPSIVIQARAEREKLAAENERMEANLRRQEELMARKALAGESRGPGQPEPPKEPTPKEFKDAFMKGEKPFPK